MINDVGSNSTQRLTKRLKTVNLRFTGLLSPSDLSTEVAVATTFDCPENVAAAIRSFA